MGRLALQHREHLFQCLTGHSGEKTGLDIMARHRDPNPSAREWGTGHPRWSAVLAAPPQLPEVAWEHSSDKPMKTSDHFLARLLFRKVARELRTMHSSSTYDAAVSSTAPPAPCRPEAIQLRIADSVCDHFDESRFFRKAA